MSEQASKPIFSMHPELYHYTNYEGVTGILKSQTIFATNYKYLKDSEEMLCFEDILRDFCHRLKDDELTEAEAHRCPTLLREALLKKGLEPYTASFYSVAASDEYEKANGSPSQWREYGGYALVFDTRRLELFVEEERTTAATPIGGICPGALQIDEVVYNASEAINRFTDDLKLLALLISRMGEKSAYATGELAGFIPLFMRCMPFCKKQKFKEEREVRIVKFLPNETHFSGIEYAKPTIKNRGDTKYIELFNRCAPLKRFEKNWLPITKIIVGPSMDQDAREERLKGDLHRMNKRKIDVTKSKIISPKSNG